MGVIYNTGHRFTKSIQEPTQNEIFGCPEYFAMSREEVSKVCPDFLKKVLDEFPWSGKKTSLQIRPQDFRNSPPVILGRGIHVDTNVRLNDGTVRSAKDAKDFKIMGVSFGGVVETNFIQNAMELEDVFDPSVSHGDFFAKVSRLPITMHSPANGQLAEYTSLDIHTTGFNFNLGRVRLLILAIESDNIDGGGIVLPSIKERELKGGPGLMDYIS